jgi:hypothetical protein
MNEMANQLLRPTAQEGEIKLHVGRRLCVVNTGIRRFDIFLADEERGIGGAA